MKRLIVMAALCGSTAAFAQPVPNPLDKPAKDPLKERALPTVTREPVVRTVTVRIHRIVDGFMIAGQKITAEEKRAYQEPIFHPTTKRELVGNMSVFEDRLWLDYQIPDPQLFKRLEKDAGKEVTIKVRDPRPGRVEVVGIL